jgi:hypothetical protein
VLFTRSWIVQLTAILSKHIAIHLLLVSPLHGILAMLNVCKFVLLSLLEILPILVEIL